STRSSCGDRRSSASATALSSRAHSLGPARWAGDPCSPASRPRCALRARAMPTLPGPAARGLGAFASLIHGWREGMSSAPRTLGAGDSLDHYIDLCFRARPDGSVLFFRWRYGRGYVIDSADKHEQVRQCVRTWMRLALLPMPGIALHAVLG